VSQPYTQSKFILDQAKIPVLHPLFSLSLSQYNFLFYVEGLGAVVCSHSELFLLLLMPFVLGPLTYLPPELIWNYGSYKHLVGLLGRGISPSQDRYLHRRKQKQKEREQTSMPLVGFEPTVPVFEWVKTCRGLDRAATVVDHDITYSS
jgi:hypothetical protein